MKKQIDRTPFNIINNSYEWKLSINDQNTKRLLFFYGWLHDKCRTMLLVCRCGNIPFCDLYMTRFAHVCGVSDPPLKVPERSSWYKTMHSTLIGLSSAFVSFLYTKPWYVSKSCLWVRILDHMDWDFSCHYPESIFGTLPRCLCCHHHRTLSYRNGRDPCSLIYCTGCFMS